MTLEDLSQRRAQAKSSTGRVQGMFGLPGHAEGGSGEDGLLSLKLDEVSLPMWKRVSVGHHSFSNTQQ